MNYLVSVLFYVLALVFSAVLGPFLAMVIARLRQSPGAKPLIVLVLAASIWSAGYAAEIVSQGLEAKLFWAKFQYFGITAIPLAWFLFSIQYLGTPAWLARFRRFWPLLGIIPALTLILVWTNAYHHWMWETMEIKVLGPLLMLVVEYGPWFWVYFAYGYLLLFLGSTWLISRLIGSERLLHWQVGLTIIAVLIPWIGNLLYVTRAGPGRYIDWTPFGFSIAGLLFTVSLFRFQMVKVVPIALRTAFEELADSILVLDLHNCVIDLNRAARELIGLPPKKLLGTPLAQALPELAGMNEAGNITEEIILARSPGACTYELHVTPLTDQAGRPIGRLIVLHDITQRRQQQAQLEEAYAQLEDRVSERTEALLQANLQLEAELDQRRLAEGRFEDIVNIAPSAVLVIDPGGKIQLANTRAEKYFGWSKTEFIGLDIEEIVPERFRSRYHEEMRQFITRPTPRQIDPPADLFAKRRDGTQFPVEVYLSPLKTSEGFLIGCVIRDISIQKNAEQEQANLLKEVKQSQKQLRALTASLEEAQENERRRIASELHDRVGQNLTALNLNLTSIQNRLPTGLNASTRDRLVDSLELVEETTRQVRSVMAELNPPLLDEFGLLPAVRWYGEKFSERTGIRVAISGEECKPRPPRKMEITLYRIIQEALNNVAKHARATLVTITCQTSKNMLHVILEDDGVGFDPTEIDPSDEQPRWGLLSMQERAAAIGGHVIIQSEPGKGTRILVEVRKR